MFWIKFYFEILMINLFHFNWSHLRFKNHTSFICINENMIFIYINFLYAYLYKIRII